MAFATSPRPVPPYREPKGLVLRFYRELKALLAEQSRRLSLELLTGDHWKQLTEAIRARLGIRDALDESANDRVYRRLDEEHDDLDELLKKVNIAIQRDQPDALLDDIVRRYGEEVSDHTRDTFRKQFKAALGLDHIGGSPRAREILKSYVKDNVSLIKTIRRQKFDRVREIVERNWRVGARWETITVHLKAEFKLDDHKAMRIARDQVGKLNAELSRDRQLAAGVEHFVWRTSKDSRVRELHRRLEGKIFTWKKGHPTEGMPGWPIQCRCYAEPVFINPKTGKPEAGLGELDQVPFPRTIRKQYARTSGGPKARPHQGPLPPKPKRRTTEPPGPGDARRERERRAKKRSKKPS